MGSIITKIFNENNMKTEYGTFAAQYYAVFATDTPAGDIEAKDEFHYKYKAQNMAKDINKIINGSTIIRKHFYSVKQPNDYVDAIALETSDTAVEMGKVPTSPERITECVFSAEKGLKFKEVAKKVLAIEKYLLASTKNYVEIGFIYPMGDTTHTLMVKPDSTVRSLEKDLNGLIAEEERSARSSHSNSAPMCK